MRTNAPGNGRTARRAVRRAAGSLAAAVLLVSAAFTPGCYTTQLNLLRSGLDSLRAQVDTLTVRDAVTYRVIADTRAELAQQRDLLLSTRASSGSTNSELFDHMSRLEGKLDDVMQRFREISARATSPAPVQATPPAAAHADSTVHAPAPPAAAPGPDPAQLYDQASRDLTEGRYPMALAGFREFLARFPEAGLAGNAQYGLAESFFAQSAFDSAAVAYAEVGKRWPKSERLAAAMYKTGLCQERLGRAADARRTFQDLVSRFPGSGEAGLAKERLVAGKR